MTKTQALLTAITSAVAILLLNTLIVQACWNYFVPAVLSLPQISFFQAMVFAVGVRSLKGAAPSLSLTGKKEES